MLDSIKTWLNSKDQRQADRQILENEAKEFKMPSETLPQIFKYVFFIGLGFLNYRLFAHAVPGLWGQTTGVAAVMAEAIALYSTHNFSRASGAFRYALGICGALLMGFSLVHGTFSILDLIGIAEVSEAVREYSRLVAFPLLAALVGLSVIALTMTHPKNIIRLKQAAAHTAVAVGRAKAASDLELMRAQSIVDQAKLDRRREMTKREQESLLEIEKLVQIEERKYEMVAAISNPKLREELARELDITLPTSAPSPTFSAPAPAPAQTGQNRYNNGLPTLP
jgi:hypothetical protein